MARSTTPQPEDERDDQSDAPTVDEQARESHAEATIETAPATVPIRMRVFISGSRNGEDWPLPGETLAVPEGEAVDLIANGYATHHDAEEHATAETATVETATPAGKRSIKASSTDKADGGE